jgi:hypothetical protein
MNEAVKMTALSHVEVRERLLSKRHDAGNHVSSPSNALRAASPIPPPAVPVPSQKEERICAYSKCGLKFTPVRKAQLYHSPDCRKRAWFERNFVPIAKP